MRWKKRKKKIKIEPSIGEERTHYYFAYIPILIGEEWVWLERFKVIAVWSPNDPHRIQCGYEWQYSHSETIKRI